MSSCDRNGARVSRIGSYAVLRTCQTRTVCRAELGYLGNKVLGIFLVLWRTFG